MGQRFSSTCLRQIYRDVATPKLLQRFYWFRDCNNSILLELEQVTQHISDSKKWKNYFISKSDVIWTLHLFVYLPRKTNWFHRITENLKMIIRKIPGRERGARPPVHHLPPPSASYGLVTKIWLRNLFKLPGVSLCFWKLWLFCRRRLGRLFLQSLSSNNWYIKINNNIQDQRSGGKCAIVDEANTMQVLLALHFLM